MKYVSFTLVLLLTAQTYAEERFTIQSVADQVFLLNTETGESHMLDVDRHEWIPLQKTASPTSQGQLAGRLRVLPDDLKQVREPMPGRKGMFAEAKALITNTTESSRNYSVAVKVPRGSQDRAAARTPPH